MKISVRELILQSLEALVACVSSATDGSATGGAEESKGGGNDSAWRDWAQDWPRQVYGNKLY